MWFFDVSYLNCMKKMTCRYISCFSSYYLNLLDLNLFAQFGLLDCKVNYLLMILGVQILCEGSAVEGSFCISVCNLPLCKYISVP